MKDNLDPVPKLIQHNRYKLLKSDIKKQSLILEQNISYVS